MLIVVIYGENLRKHFFASFLTKKKGILEKKNLLIYSWNNK